MWLRHAAAVLASSVVAAGITPVIAVPATAESSTTACFGADTPVRTKPWWKKKHPDWSEKKINSYVALMEGIAGYAVECLVNEERKKARIAPLKYNSSLFKAAKKHLNDAKYYKWWYKNADPATYHRFRGREDGADQTDRARAAGYCKGGSSWYVKENVYQGWDGTATPRAAVRWWMEESPSHRATILDPTMKEAAVSAQYGKADSTNREALNSDIAMVTAQVFGRCS
jgi:uncharacterized protein YkwD